MTSTEKGRRGTGGGAEGRKGGDGGARGQLLRRRTPSAEAAGLGGGWRAGTGGGKGRLWREGSGGDARCAAALAVPSRGALACADRTRPSWVVPALRCQHARPVSLAELLWPPHLPVVLQRTERFFSEQVEAAARAPLAVFPPGSAEGLASSEAVRVRCSPALRLQVAEWPRAGRPRRPSGG